ncbi:MAG TPA: bi-domain-containing oxidoreductase [Prolixibacteraceae bacterium]|nr:bi-domain-containing oxidoreductase [Prolixibacteraceae bacterium]
MRQLAQNIKKKTLTIEDLPVPVCKAGGVLVKTIYSAVSVGTEVMKLKNSDLSYLQMAKKKPEQVKEVFNSISQMGPVATYRKVMNKLDSMSPLGYSLVGEVIETGKGIDNLKIGDIVACGGAGYANHAEINFVPKNLCVKVPAEVELKEASLTTIASIAMQGYRQANCQIGENIAVIGLGLLGQILIKIIQANGCRAFGFDISKSKCELALANGAYYAEVASKTNFDEEILLRTNGQGCDAIILTTGTSSNDPILLAGNIARDKAKVVDIGITKMDLPWELYYHKELDFSFSRSYGPGRYDPNYEESGIDYPIGHVRWTEQRNMHSILQLLADKRISFANLITHEYNFSDSERVFMEIKEGKENYLGVILAYDHNIDANYRKVELSQETFKKEEPTIGVIGAGNYASTMLLPFLKSKSNLVGIATATGINAKDKAQKFGFNYATTDYKEMLQDKNINTILIATRHNQHGRMVYEALEQKKNVYVEKPLAISIEELVSIYKKYINQNLLLMVGYNRRYSASINYLKQQLQKDNSYSIYYQVNAGYIPMDKWYQSQDQGGRLIGEACHFIDTVQYLLDSDPIEVYANSSEASGMPAQDNSFITIKFRNGSSCVIAYLADGEKSYSKEKIFITGNRTNIEFDNFKTITVHKDGKTSTKKFMLIDKGQKAEMEVLLNSVKTGEQPVSIESILLNTYTSIMAVESLKTNKSYKVSLNDLTA